MIFLAAHIMPLKVVSSEQKNKQGNQYYVYNQSFFKLIFTSSYIQERENRFIRLFEMQNIFSKIFQNCSSLLNFSLY